eukprot:TRINITY_DN45711_c0_g1_i1.p1 TRINITY_DN45711_c0_g1~~TRINITY_DN45711_c0_g1_i1.p1  ORF type:complete len:883 (-),score=290.55 TRINITY_DN45711_c0_g1_i1:91-2739(-)
MEPRQRNDMEVTQEEVAKLNKAMKDDQFRKYMDEYCKETSDPAHRREYIQYLDQLEAKGEMPEGQALLRCQPGCCVKTSIRFKNGQTQKCFINIVHSDQLDDFRLDEANAKGRKVHLPYSLSPPRPDRDHKQDYCMTCDLAVSSVTYFQGMQNPQILKMLVDTAADGLGNNFLKGFEEVKKDFKVMQNLRCKGGFPMPMSVKASLLKDGGRKAPKPSVSAMKDAVTPSELKQMRAEIKQKKTSEQEEEERQAQARERAAEARRKAQQEPAPGPQRIRVPVHRLVHSGQLNLTDFMESDNPAAQAAVSTVPRTLRLVVELPTVKKVSDVSLEVTSFNVVVEVPNKYYLDLPLPYEIDDANGSAKFDKTKQTLTLELPVKPKAPDPELLRNFGRFSSQVEEVEAEGEDGALREGVDGGLEDDELPPLADEPPAAAEEAAAKAPQGSSTAPVSESPAPASPSAETSQPSAANGGASRRRDGGLLEFGDPGGGLRLVEKTGEGDDEARELGDGVTELADAPGADFEAADAFAGARPGFVFKLGDLGLGYYRDLRQSLDGRDGKKDVRLRRAEDDDESSDDGGAAAAPLVTEIAPAKGKRVDLPPELRRYVDESTALRAPLEEEPHAGETDAVLTWHQTRQNMTVFLELPADQEVADVQLELTDRRFQLAYCTRPRGKGGRGGRWRRHGVRRILCGDADPSQWHAALEPGPGGCELLALVLRKVDQSEPWREAFDAAALASGALSASASSAGAAESADAGKRGAAAAAADAAATTGAAAAEASAAAEARGGGAAPSSPKSREAAGAGGAGAPASGRAAATLVDMEAGVAEDSAALDAAVPASHAEGPDGSAVVGPSPAPAAATALAQSAAVMGQSVLLRNRLLYQLL